MKKKRNHKVLHDLKELTFEEFCEAVNTITHNHGAPRVLPIKIPPGKSGQLEYYNGIWDKIKIDAEVKNIRVRFIKNGCVVLGNNEQPPIFTYKVDYSRKIK